MKAFTLSKNLTAVLSKAILSVFILSFGFVGDGFGKGESEGDATNDRYVFCMKAELKDGKKTLEAREACKFHLYVGESSGCAEAINKYETAVSDFKKQCEAYPEFEGDVEPKGGFICSKRMDICKDCSSSSPGEYKSTCAKLKPDQAWVDKMSETDKYSPKLQMTKFDFANFMSSMKINPEEDDDEETEKKISDKVFKLQFCPAMDRKDLDKLATAKEKYERAEEDLELEISRLEEKINTTSSDLEHDLEDLTKEITALQEGHQTDLEKAKEDFEAENDALMASFEKLNNAIVEAEFSKAEAEIKYEQSIQGERDKLAGIESQCEAEAYQSVAKEQEANVLRIRAGKNKSKSLASALKTYGQKRQKFSSTRFSRYFTPCMQKSSVRAQQFSIEKSIARMTKAHNINISNLNTRISQLKNQQTQLYNKIPQNERKAADKMARITQRAQTRIAEKMATQARTQRKYQAILTKANSDLDEKRKKLFSTQQKIANAELDFEVRNNFTGSLGSYDEVNSGKAEAARSVLKEKLSAVDLACKDSSISCDSIRENAAKLGRPFTTAACGGGTSSPGGPAPASTGGGIENQ